MLLVVSLHTSHMPHSTRLSGELYIYIYFEFHILGNIDDELFSILFNGTNL